MAIYSTSNINPIQIESASFGEVTIKLHVSKPSITVKNPPYISGVANSSGVITNNKTSIELDSFESIILNNIKGGSASESAEVTLKLNTKLTKA